MELSIINKKLAMDSRDIALLTQKKHFNVLRDIRTMCKNLGIFRNEYTYLDSQNKPQPYYLLNYEDTMTLLTGYSVKLRNIVIKRWLYLEQHYKEERQKSIEVRNTFTDELKDRGYNKHYEYIQTTTQMKKPLEITHKKDEMTEKELKAIRASEALSSLLLDDEYGYHEVNPVCIKASEKVAEAVAEKKTTLIA